MKHLEAEVSRANETTQRLASELGSSDARLQAEQEDNARLLEELRLSQEQISHLNDTLSQARRDLDFQSEK